MAIMLVSYDLNMPGQNYSGLINAIQTYTHKKALKSAWLIETSATPVAVRDRLKGFIDPGDNILVTRFGSDDWASFMPQDVNDWLGSPSRNWA